MMKTPIDIHAGGIDLLGFAGEKSREAPNNLKPVGTGPYLFVDFKPGDMLRAKINPNYHVANRPHFDEVEVKGGGDLGLSAALNAPIESTSFGIFRM